jgi:hypothetical protein
VTLARLARGLTLLALATTPARAEGRRVTEGTLPWRLARRRGQRVWTDGTAERAQPRRFAGRRRELAAT